MSRLKTRFVPRGDECERAQGIDYVNGHFGPQSSVDHRKLQVRWLDHYLKGIDNGIDVQAPLDILVSETTRAGKNVSGGWHGVDQLLPARMVSSRLPRGSEPADEYTYDLGNPTPFLVDARELELKSQ